MSERTMLAPTLLSSVMQRVLDCTSKSPGAHFFVPPKNDFVLANRENGPCRLVFFRTD